MGNWDIKGQIVSKKTEIFPQSLVVDSFMILTLKLKKTAKLHQ